MTNKQILKQEGLRLNAKCRLLWWAAFKYRGVIWKILVYKVAPDNRRVDNLFLHETRLTVYRGGARQQSLSLYTEWKKGKGGKVRISDSN